MTSKFSLLSKKESKRNIRQAVFFSFLTIALVALIFIYGIPAVIKMAVFIGNLRSSTTPVESNDNIPPSPPIFKTLPEATNNAKINLHGFAESGSDVKIYLTGQSVNDVIADNDGNFSMDNLELTLGKNEITAMAVDNAGNKSRESEKLVVWYDNQPPELEVNQPADKSIITSENSKVEIVGKTEPEANLSINEHFVVLDSDGNFKYTFPLSQGENLINIVASDKAGNQTTKELNLNYSP
jgi:bacillopeptidase F